MKAANGSTLPLSISLCQLFKEWWAGEKRSSLSSLDVVSLSFSPSHYVLVNIDVIQFQSKGVGANGITVLSIAVKIETVWYT